MQAAAHAEQERHGSDAERAPAPGDVALLPAGYAAAPLPRTGPARVLALQRAAGNAAVARLVARGPATAASDARAGPDGGGRAPRSGQGAAFDTSLIDRELAAVTAHPGVAATKASSGRNLLVPSAPPPAPPPIPAPPAGAAHAAAAPTAAPAPGGGEAEAAGRRDAEIAQALATAGGRAAPAEGAPGAGAPTAGGPVTGGPAPAGTASPEAAQAAMAAATAGLVADPAPGALRSQLPEAPSAEAVEEALADERPPEEQAAVAQAEIAGLRGAADHERAGVRADVGAHRERIQAQGQARRAEIDARLAAGLADLAQRAASTRVQLTGAAEGRRAELRTQVEADAAAVRDATTAKVAEARQAIADKRTALLRAGEAERADALAAAETEAARATGELEAAALDCEAAGEQEAARHPGDEEPAPERREAARQVGRESAADIRAKKPDLLPELRAKAVEHGDRCVEYVRTVVPQLDDAERALVERLQELGRQAETAVRDELAGAVAAVDERLAADLAAVDATTDALRAQLGSAAATAGGALDTDVATAVAEIEVSGQALDAELDHTATETTEVLSAPEEPFLPGVLEQVGGARAQLASTAGAGRTQLGTAAAGADGRFAASAAAFGTAADDASAQSAERLDGLVAGFGAAAERTLAARRESGAAILDRLRGQQEQVTTAVLDEAERACEAARTELGRMRGEYTRTVREAADRAVEEGIRPKTDDVHTRTHEAAAQVDDGFWAGLGRAVLQIAVGLVVLVVVALLVAAVAAAFGVLLTAWTAIMIAGALLLAASLVFALIHRLGQRELAGRPGTAILVALADTVGITGIYEGIRGRDMVTGAVLTTGQQTERGVLGAFTLITLVLGARSAVKGPPGGMYTRPVGSVPGWSGLGAWGRAVAGAKAVAGEMASAIASGVRSVRAWWARRRGGTPEEGPARGTEQGPEAGGPQGEQGPYARAEDGYVPDRIFLDHIPKEIPPEGWKLHVSADAASARPTADAVLPVLRRMGANHKVVGTPEGMARMTGGQEGKFITIYPDDAVHARAIVAAVDGVLSGRSGSGPPVAGEMPVGSSGRVYTRYGGFTKSTVTDPSGIEVPDVRGQMHPPWIQNPFTSSPVPPAPVPVGPPGRDEQ